MATKVDTELIENYLSKIGKKDSKGMIYFSRVLFDLKKTKTGIDIILDSPDTDQIVRNFKGEMIKSLKGQFKNFFTVTDRILPGVRERVARLKYSDNGMKFVDFEVRNYPYTGKSGALNAKISEPATMMVLNAALESKGKVFKTQEDIFVNDVYKDLEKLFGRTYGHKLDEWIYTFLTQNKLFFENYGRYKWAKFKHKAYQGQRDMQSFFNEHLKNLTLAPGVTAGRNYEQWNPADLWAVKRSDQKSLEEEIEAETKSPSADNLIKLNTHLVKLMEKNELVGISLKKIDSGGTFKIFNVDSSKLLTNLKSFKKLEEFDMSDIHFELKNVFENFPGKPSNVPAATNYILYGSKVIKSSKFLISITRGGMAIVFNTSIPSDTGAQGGQTLKSSVLELLRKGGSGVSFKNDFKDYPKTANDFVDLVESNSPKIREYEKWFNFVYNHPKNNHKNGLTFDTWKDSIYKAYEARLKNGYGIAGVTKLALLNFWYDALRYHDKDHEFWTDLLYFGLKITTKGQFGPHAKIS